MDHSIKKKPEKPRMRQSSDGAWSCTVDNWRFFCAFSGTEAYQMWQRTHAALNKHEGKS